MTVVEMTGPMVEFMPNVFTIMILTLLLFLVSKLEARCLRVWSNLKMSDVLLQISD